MESNLQKSIIPKMRGHKVEKSCSYKEKIVMSMESNLQKSIIPKMRGHKVEKSCSYKEKNSYINGIKPTEEHYTKNEWA